MTVCIIVLGVVCSFFIGLYLYYSSQYEVSQKELRSCEQERDDALRRCDYIGSLLDECENERKKLGDDNDSQGLRYLAHYWQTLWEGCDQSRQSIIKERDEQQQLKEFHKTQARALWDRNSDLSAQNEQLNIELRQAKECVRLYHAIIEGLQEERRAEAQPKRSHHKKPESRKKGKEPQ